MRAKDIDLDEHIKAIEVIKSERRKETKRVKGMMDSFEFYEKLSKGDYNCDYDSED